MIAATPRLLLIALLVVCAGCAEDSGPTEGGDLRVVFEPAPGNVSVDAYETIVFRAKRPDGGLLAAQWSLDAVDQGAQSEFQFLGALLGSFTLHAEAEWEGVQWSADWVLEVSDRNLSVTPIARALHAVPGQVPGSIRLSWERPPPSQAEVPITHFELFIDRAPFGDADLDAMQPVAVAIDPVPIQQSFRFEGLEEKALHYMGVRVRDALDRSSLLSALADTTATGHFDVLGTVARLQPQLPAYKGPGVLVEVDEYKTVTQTGGEFALLAVPDLVKAPLRVAEESGIEYYELRTPESWPAETRILDVVLFKRDIVLIDDGNPGGGFPDQVSMLEFLRYMSHNGSRPAGTPQTIYRWEQYPVDVYAPAFSNNGVDYRLAFERAVQSWNDAVGDELLRLVESPISVGVDYAPYTAIEMGPNSGEVVQISPPGGIFQSNPERMHIRLFDSFPNQQRCDDVVLHELGHVLMLNHSPSRQHVMVASAATIGEGVNRDEAFMARLIACLPQEFNLRWYREPSGAIAQKLGPTPNSSWCGTEPTQFYRPGG